MVFAKAGGAADGAATFGAIALPPALQPITKKSVAVTSKPFRAIISHGVLPPESIIS